MRMRAFFFFGLDPALAFHLRVAFAFGTRDEADILVVEFALVAIELDDWVSRLDLLPLFFQWLK